MLEFNRNLLIIPDRGSTYKMTLTPAFFPCNKAVLKHLAKVIKRDVDGVFNQEEAAIKIANYIKFIAYREVEFKLTTKKVEKLGKNYADFIEICIKEGWLNEDYRVMEGA